MPKHRPIIFIDDEETTREIAHHNLTQAGYQVHTAGTVAQGLALCAQYQPPVVITDLRLPDGNGLDVLQKLGTAPYPVSVIVITAFGDIQTAVSAMKKGAYDYITKPFQRAQLRLSVERALERTQLLADNRALRQAATGIERPIIYQSASIARILDLVDRTAQSSATLLITGESGTGKELVARRLHAKSTRKDGPFIAVNCAALPESLLESELFGHEAGTFTGAHKARKGRFRSAHGGTLFLDEIGEMPLTMQGKLLRALQEGQITPLGHDGVVDVDIRLVVATNQNLAQKVKEGGFRQDLYYRLNVIEVHMPPLRERVEDIPVLAAYFLAQASEGRELALSDAVCQALKRHPWPGNIRELQNACERLAILSVGHETRPEDLPPSLKGRGPENPSSAHWLDALPPELTLIDIERMVIQQALRRHHWNLSGASRVLGVPRHILAYRVQKYGITKDES